MESNTTPVLNTKTIAPSHISFNTVMSVAVLSILLSVAISFICIRLAMSYGYLDAAQTRVVALDTRSLVDAQTRAVMLTGKGNPEFIKAESERFAVQFAQLMESYKKAGYFVVHSEAIIAAPQNSNITSEFIRQLVSKPAAEIK